MNYLQFIKLRIYSTDLSDVTSPTSSSKATPYRVFRPLCCEVHSDNQSLRDQSLVYCYPSLNNQIKKDDYSVVLPILCIAVLLCHTVTPNAENNRYQWEAACLATFVYALCHQRVIIRPPLICLSAYFPQETVNSMTMIFLVHVDKVGVPGCIAKYTVLVDKALRMN